MNNSGLFKILAITLAMMAALAGCGKESVAGGADDGQIVFTSDRPPKEIPEIEERLRSRFEWGLIVDIQKPDYETRMAILRRKEEMNHVNIPDEILDYIAKNVVSNIRELEGAFNKISVYSRLEGRKQELTVEEAEDILKDIIMDGLMGN